MVTSAGNPSLDKWRKINIELFKSMDCARSHRNVARHELGGSTPKFLVSLPPKNRVKPIVLYGWATSNQIKEPTHRPFPSSSTPQKAPKNPLRGSTLLWLLSLSSLGAIQFRLFVPSPAPLSDLGQLFLLPTSCQIANTDISFEQFKRLLKTFLFGCWNRGAL